MPNLSPEQLQTCRRLTLLSVGLYATSCLIVSVTMGTTDPFAWLSLIMADGFKLACLANPTLAWGWHRLCSGRAASANFWGVVSVGLAALYWIEPVPFIDSVIPSMVAGYFGWVGSMVVLIVAERYIAPDRSEPPK